MSNQENAGFREFIRYAKDSSMKKELELYLSDCLLCGYIPSLAYFDKVEKNYKEKSNIFKKSVPLASLAGNVMCIDDDDSDVQTAASIRLEPMCLSGQVWHLAKKCDQQTHYERYDIECMIESCCCDGYPEQSDDILADISDADMDKILKILNTAAAEHPSYEKTETLIQYEDFK